MREPLKYKITSRIEVQDLGYSTPCWISNRSPQPNGYTKIGINNRTMLTHRVAYEAWHGPIPAGLVIDHLCRNRKCCNPDHLEPVTTRENLLRGETLTASEAMQTHCIHGHALAGENIYVRPDKPNSRLCRACRVDAGKRQNAKLKAIRQAA